MKLNEFVDRLYEMGDIESSKTVRPKKTLNESCGVSDESKLDESINLHESAINQDKINKALQVLIDNGIDEDEAEIVLQAIGYTLLDTELFPEDDLDESYNNDDFRNLCREYSSLYPYDISLREVWDEIVRNYEDEDLANDVVEYLQSAFGD